MLAALLSCCLLVTGTRAMRDFFKRLRRAHQRARDWKRYIQAQRLQAIYRRSTTPMWHPDGHTQPGETE